MTYKFECIVEEGVHDKLLDINRFRLKLTYGEGEVQLEAPENVFDLKKNEKYLVALTRDKIELEDFEILLRGVVFEKKIGGDKVNVKISYGGFLLQLSNFKLTEFFQALHEGEPVYIGITR